MTELDPYRLPRVAIPHHYDLMLAPDLDLGTFAGTVVVDLDIGQATRDLWCNAVDLELVSATIDHGGGTTTLQTQIERDTERVRFVADDERLHLMSDVCVELQMMQNHSTRLQDSLMI